MDDECIHGLTHATCTICKGTEPRAASSSGRSSTTTTELTTPESLERYRKRYPGDREATFEAYVEVFFRIDAARNFRGGWTMFSRCANGEPELVKTERALVQRAEEIMRAAGYVKDDSGRSSGRGRKWWKTAT